MNSTQAMIIPIFVVLLLVVAFTCLLAWSALTSRSAKLKSELLSQYRKNIQQIDVIQSLDTELNSLCESVGIKIESGTTAIQKWKDLTKATINDLKEASSWRVVVRYPMYWYYAETHVRHVAPMEQQFRELISEFSDRSAS